MVNSELEIDKKLSQASPSPKFLDQHHQGILGSSSEGARCENEHGKDEFYDPEFANTMAN